MSQMNVGFVGWRGLVGSVLMDRMREEGDFTGINSSFFSTSNPGGDAPPEGGAGGTLHSADDIDALKRNDVIISCQGGDYTNSIYPRLRNAGWSGYWIDAASALRMDNDSLIILDPVNGQKIREGLSKGIKSYIGGNCTVSLMLMALAGLFRENLVEWVHSMTYQAVSGAGAKQMIELLVQMQVLGKLSSDHLAHPAATAITLEKALRPALTSSEFPHEHLGVPIAGSLLPWIDKAVGGGQTREEWKGFAEVNKILGLGDGSEIIVDGLCVRVGVMRCHSQALLLKLRKEASLDALSSLISEAHVWAHVVENDKENTMKGLTPASVSGTLQVPVGRMHFSRLGNEYLQLFTVGDQLLWGAAEPLRRMLIILREHVGK